VVDGDDPGMSTLTAVVGADREDFHFWRNGSKVKRRLLGKLSDLVDGTSGPAWEMTPKTGKRAAAVGQREEARACGETARSRSGCEELAAVDGLRTGAAAWRRRGFARAMSSLPVPAPRIMRRHSLGRSCQLIDSVLKLQVVTVPGTDRRGHGVRAA